MRGTPWKRTGRRVEAKEERFPIDEVSQAIGRSRGSISSICSRNDISAKGGLTIEEIIVCVESPEGKKSINWDRVKRIEELLQQNGFEKQNDDQEGKDE